MQASHAMIVTLNMGARHPNIEGGCVQCGGNTADIGLVHRYALAREAFILKSRICPTYFGSALFCAGTLFRYRCSEIPSCCVLLLFDYAFVARETEFTKVTTVSHRSNKEEFEPCCVIASAHLRAMDSSLRGFTGEGRILVVEITRDPESSILNIGRIQCAQYTISRINMLTARRGYSKKNGTAYTSPISTKHYILNKIRHKKSKSGEPRTFIVASVTHVQHGRSRLPSPGAPHLRLDLQLD